MNTPEKELRVHVHATPEFIDLQTYSGYRMAVIDPSGRNYDLPPLVQDDELGRALLDALAHSRFVSVEEAYDLKGQAQENYNSWVAEKMRRHGYKSRKALFRHMRGCSVRSGQDGVIMISPLRHEKLEGWSGIDEESDVELSSASSSAEMGAALRLALSRCTE